MTKSLLIKGAQGFQNQFINQGFESAFNKSSLSLNDILTSKLTVLVLVNIGKMAAILISKNRVSLLLEKLVLNYGALRPCIHPQYIGISRGQGLK